jgi:predicted Zn finger-like uncharacterized protein
MILTCPDCASRYFVDDARVGAKGRTVRCASCGLSWRAMPDAASAEQTLALAVPTSFAPADATPSEPDRPAPLPNQIRAEAMEKKKAREAVAIGVVWAGLGAGFVALVFSAALFRVDIVRLWPQAAGAYAFARMPVNPTGLALETVQGQPNLLDGHAALSVTAVERNVETSPRPSMPLRVILYDKAGKRLTSAVAAPPVRIIAPGDTRPFAVNFIDPPVDGASFVVEFAFDKVAPKPDVASAAKPSGRAMGQLAMRGPVAAPAAGAISAAAPQTAKPLPADSPYALPLAASAETAR